MAVRDYQRDYFEEKFNNLGKQIAAIDAKVDPVVKDVNWLKEWRANVNGRFWGIAAVTSVGGGGFAAYIGHLFQ